MIEDLMLIILAWLSLGIFVSLCFGRVARLMAQAGKESRMTHRIWQTPPDIGCEV